MKEMVRTWDNNTLFYFLFFDVI